MGISDNINILMDKKGISRYKLAKLSQIPYTTLIKVLDGTTKNPQIETLSAVAEVLGVSVDSLSGHSIGALIRQRLRILDMSIEYLAEETNLSLEQLQDIDNMHPQPSDYETGGFLDKVSKALEMNRGLLSAALGRQEPQMNDKLKSSVEDNSGEYDTIAAHHEGEVWTEEELEEIKRFKEFVKSKRKSEE